MLDRVTVGPNPHGLTSVAAARSDAWCYTGHDDQRGAENGRSRAVLMATYAAGLRLSEVCALQLGDCESAPDRMCIKVGHGKGGKDRYTLLSPRLLDTLGLYWRARRPRPWLFPNGSGDGPLFDQTAQRMYHAARRAAGIEPGGRIHTIQRLMGHGHVSTTTRYFHLVFALPHDLKGLIAAAPRPLYENLFSAVSATLAEFAARSRHLGGVPTFSLVLHTWKQDLARHVHFLALVAGGALPARCEWIAPKRGFLFPVRALSRVFRGKFLAGLEALHRADGLPGLLAPPAEWRRLKQRLPVHDWVVYAKQPLCKETVLIPLFTRRRLQTIPTTATLAKPNVPGSGTAGSILRLSTEEKSPPPGSSANRKDRIVAADSVTGPRGLQHKVSGSKKLSTTIPLMSRASAVNTPNPCPL